MKLTLWTIFVYFYLFQKTNASFDETKKNPTIVIVSLIRNKAHTLPYFFSYLEQLDFPKERITLWFRSDHNEDNTIEIIDAWLNKVSNLYHEVNFKYESQPKIRQTEKTATDWPIERHKNVIDLKEEGLNYARQVWSDFVLFLDADVFLTDRLTLKELIDKELPIVSPMLLSDGLYSNFWCGITSEFYYQRTDEYKEIYNYNKRGDFSVPMIHSAVLVNLRYIATDNLTFNRTMLHKQLVDLNKSPIMGTVPMDDIIIFALSANYSGIQLHISNTHSYGYIMVPIEENEDFRRDIEQLVNLKISIINDVENGLVIEPELKKFIEIPPKDQLSLTKIFMINLERRTERRARMMESFDTLGLDVENFNAIDGMELNEESLKKIGIEFLPGYVDPYLKRPMTLGEVGCFLSHYYIWKKIVEENLSEVLILEDDIRFEPYFKDRALSVLNEARSIGGWDMIYFGRKRLESQDEKWIPDSELLVKAGYSYWTLGYVLTLAGAKKLLDADPLKRLLPVDEFLPIMFDRHQNSTWKNTFEIRNLEAWSAAPLILFPTYYTGEDGYVSDTEDSMLINSNEEINNETIEKKGNKEIPIEDTVNELPLSDDDEIVDVDNPHNILINTISESIAEAIKTEF